MTYARSTVSRHRYCVFTSAVKREFLRRHTVQTVGILGWGIRYWVPVSRVLRNGLA